MGAWGTGIKNSDAFADVYETFYNLYNEGVTPENATEQIVSNFKEIQEIKEEEHDFWFALALAQWETKSLHTSVLSKVENIVSSESNLKLWKELGATDKDLYLRKIALDKFIQQIRSPRPKAKARRKFKAKSPIFKAGDCIVFKLKDGNYGGAVVIEAEHDPRIASNLIATTRLNQSSKPTLEDFKSAEVLLLNFGNWQDRTEIVWYMPDHFAKFYLNTFELVGNLNVEFEYDNSNPGGRGFLFQPSYTAGWNMNDIADLQFESEKTVPKPMKVLTIKQFIKKGL